MNWQKVNPWIKYFEKSRAKIQEGKSMEQDIVVLSISEEDSFSQVGFLHQMSVRETFKLHSHDFYEIFYVPEGRAIHNVNKQNEVIFTGTLELIRPEDTHKYEFMNQYDMELISFGFEKVVMEQLCHYMGWDIKMLHQSAMPPKIVFTGTQVLAIKNLLLKIPECEAGKKRIEYVKSFLPDMLYKLFNSHKQENRLIPKWLNMLAMQMSVRENYVEGLPKMLKLSHVTQEHLNREFKKYFHITPTEFINMKRVSYAAELLLEGTESVTEICGICGFNTLSHFYEMFKKMNRCTPSEFVKCGKSEDLIKKINIQDKNINA